MRFLDVYVAVNEGELLGVYSSPEEAEGRANSESDENFDYAADEYGLDPDEDTSQIEFIAGYDGGCPYSDWIRIKVDEPDETYCTCEGDCFTGGHLMSMYEGDVEEDCYNVECEEDSEYDKL